MPPINISNAIKALNAMPVHKPGDTGVEIAIVQEMLNLTPPSGLAVLDVTGVYDAATVDRVKEFQQSYGIAPVNGVMTHLTMFRLQHQDGGSAIHHKGCGNCLSLVGPVGATAAAFPSSVRMLTTAEIAAATSVFGSSIVYSLVFISNGLGFSGRPFTTVLPVLPPGFPSSISPGPFTLINAGDSPTSALLLHELVHVWQSQHHPDPVAFMANSVASQLGAILVGGNPYAYVPGRSFGLYAAEQIAKQIEDGEAAIINHVAAALPLVPDVGNIASLLLPRWEVSGSPGVVG